MERRKRKKGVDGVMEEYQQPEGLGNGKHKRDEVSMANVFASVTLYEFGGANISALLAGLSAMDGSSAYINEA